MGICFHDRQRFYANSPFHCSFIIDAEEWACITNSESAKGKYQVQYYTVVRFLFSRHLEPNFGNPYDNLVARPKPFVVSGQHPLLPP